MVRQSTYADGRWDGQSLRDWIPSIVSDVVEAVSPLRVILFGSVARGEEGADSDVDLLVILDEVDPAQRRRLMGRIRGAIDAPVPVDVLVVGQAEYEIRKDIDGSPYCWPAREGQVAYERPAA